MIDDKPIPVHTMQCIS